MLVNSLISKTLLVVVSVTLQIVSRLTAIHGQEILTCQDGDRNYHILSENSSSAILCADWRYCRHKQCVCDIVIRAQSERGTLKYRLMDDPRSSSGGCGVSLRVFDEGHSILVSYLADTDTIHSCNLQFPW